MKDVVFCVCVLLSMRHSFGQVDFKYAYKFESRNYPGKHIGYNQQPEESGQREGYMTDNGKRFFIRPGLTGESGTVSLESADFPGSFFRHFGSQLDLEDKESGRNGDIFDEDATFTIHENKWHIGFVSFECTNYRGRYIRHRGSRLYTEQEEETDLFRSDASWRYSQGPLMLQTIPSPDCLPSCKLGRNSFDGNAASSDKGVMFNIVYPGLSGEAGSASFQQSNSPFIYLRELSGELLYENSSNPSDGDTFFQDASFLIHLEQFYEESIAIETAYGGLYMRRREFEIRAEMNDGSSAFEKSSSWIPLEGPLFLQQYNSNNRITVDHKNHAVITLNGTRFHLIYPGLSGHPGSLSLQSYENTNYYLRHYDYELHLEHRDTGRNQDIFDKDASFFIRHELYYADSMSMESVNYPDYFIMVSGSRVRISKDDDSAIFRQSASFKKIEGPTDLPRNNNPSSTNKAAIIGVSCSLAVIIVMIIMAFLIDRFMIKRKAEEDAIEEGIANPVYDVMDTHIIKGKESQPPQTKDVSTKSESKDKVTLDPLPSVSSLVRRPLPPTPNPVDNTQSSASSQKAKQNSNVEDVYSVPLRNSIQNKLRRISGSFTRADNKQNRKADIPGTFDIDFTKPFDFDTGNVDTSNIGFGNPLFGQQPSRMSMQFDDLPSPLDFGVDGFEKGSSSDNTPITPVRSDLFFDDSVKNNYAAVKRKNAVTSIDEAVGSIENHVSGESDSSDEEERKNALGSQNNFFGDEPFSDMPTSTFPKILRKKSEDNIATEEKKKRVSWSENVRDSLPDDAFSDLDESQSNTWQSVDVAEIFPGLEDPNIAATDSEA